MIIREVKYNSWHDFKSNIVLELYSGEIFVSGKYVFRGQGSADWKLMPSFDRWISKFKTSRKFDIYYKLIDAFKYECSLADIDDEIKNNENSLIALGQHYGLPTRLLDWSKSPYVAAFFAFNESLMSNVKNGDVAIWALQAHSEYLSEEAGIKIIEISFRDNLRMRNQEGVFTVLKTLDSSLDDYITSIESEDTILIKFIIPVTEAEKAISDLYAMGITYNRVYPELSGHTMSACVRTILNMSV